MTAASALNALNRLATANDLGSWSCESGGYLTISGKCEEGVSALMTALSLKALGRIKNCAPTTTTTSIPISEAYLSSLIFSDADFATTNLTAFSDAVVVAVELLPLQWAHELDFVVNQLKSGSIIAELLLASREHKDAFDAYMGENVFVAAVEGINYQGGLYTIIASSSSDANLDNQKASLTASTGVLAAICCIILIMGAVFAWNKKKANNSAATVQPDSACEVDGAEEFSVDDDARQPVLMASISGSNMQRSQASRTSVGSLRRRHSSTVEDARNGQQDDLDSFAVGGNPDESFVAGGNLGEPETAAIISSARPNGIRFASTHARNSITRAASPTHYASNLEMYRPVIPSSPTSLLGDLPPLTNNFPPGRGHSVEIAASRRAPSVRPHGGRVAPAQFDPFADFVRNGTTSPTHIQPTSGSNSRRSSMGDSSANNKEYSGEFIPPNDTGGPAALTGGHPQVVAVRVHDPRRRKNSTTSHGSIDGSNIKLYGNQAAGRHPGPGQSPRHVGGASVGQGHLVDKRRRPSNTSIRSLEIFQKHQIGIGPSAARRPSEPAHAGPRSCTNAVNTANVPEIIIKLQSPTAVKQAARRVLNHKQPPVQMPTPGPQVLSDLLASKEGPTFDSVKPSSNRPVTRPSKDEFAVLARELEKIANHNNAPKETVHPTGSVDGRGERGATSGSNTAEIAENEKEGGGQQAKSSESLHAPTSNALPASAGALPQRLSRSPTSGHDLTLTQELDLLESSIVAEATQSSPPTAALANTLNVNIDLPGLIPTAQTRVELYQNEKARNASILELHAESEFSPPTMSSTTARVDGATESDFIKPVKRASPKAPRRRGRGADQPTVRELHRKPTESRPPSLPAKVVALDNSLEELDIDAEARAMGLIPVTACGSDAGGGEPAQPLTTTRAASLEHSVNRVSHQKGNNLIVLPPTTLDPIMQGGSFLKQMQDLPEVRGLHPFGRQPTPGSTTAATATAMPAREPQASKSSIGPRSSPDIYSNALSSPPTLGGSINNLPPMRGQPKPKAFVKSKRSNGGGVGNSSGENSSMHVAVDGTIGDVGFEINLASQTSAGVASARHSNNSAINKSQKLSTEALLEKLRNATRPKQQVSAENIGNSGDGDGSKPGGSSTP